MPYSSRPRWSRQQSRLKGLYVLLIRICTPRCSHAPQSLPDPSPFTKWNRAYHAMPKQSRSASVSNRPPARGSTCGLVLACVHISSSRDRHSKL
ncbi:hypothetical protein BD310DRAFT_937504 [Dichomitus squalens]|uniref:Uncharacterized protein n=1 Tax=Dichomitus squalens TaxID=114155 RepID=A0A4Q9PFG0_9APHY|nr:hypothetical protein BD310DRAFT_937504 [Dichomitus squalens]